MWGWHTETTKTTTVKKKNGSTTNKRTKTSTLQVTDWEYFVDCTPYINPVGFMRAEQGGEAAGMGDVLEGFVKCPKASKRLEMSKYVANWDAMALEARITEHLATTQSHLYTGKFSVKFELLQDQAQVLQEGLCEACLMSNSCRIFLTLTCCCTCYCCWSWHFLSKYGEGGFNGRLKSEFRLMMDEEAFFRAVKPSLLMGSPE